MKTMNFEFRKDIFEGFELSAEELINVRGGDGGGNEFPTLPPVKI